MSWVLGLAFSLVVGHFVVEHSLQQLRKYIGLDDKPALPEPLKRVPPWLTGALERLFFTFLIAFNVSGTPTAMVGWLALKLATNWNHPDFKESAQARSFAFSGLVAGLLSMLVALLGGKICAS